MKRIYTTALMALCAVLLYAQQGGLSYDWAKKIGQSAGTGNDNVRRLVVSNGYVYIIGGFQSTVDFNPGTDTANLVSAGSNDIYFAKYTTAGDYVWAKRIGGSGDDYGMSLALGDNDTIVIVGYYSVHSGGAIDFNPGPATNGLSSGGSVEGFVAKYDQDGNYQWARRITGTLSDYAYGVALDSSENIFICGTIGSTNITFEHPFSPAVQVNFTDPADLYFAKYDRAGRCLYGKAFQGGATTDVVARDIAVDANDDVYITGHFVGTCDFDASAGGTASIFTSVNTDAFLVKYTNAGNYIWVRQMGGTTTTPSQNDNGTTIDITPSGNIIVGGAYWGVGVFGGVQITAQGNTLAGFFCSWTPAGTCNWAKGISGTGTSNQAQVYQTTHDDAGNIYVTGRFTGATVDFDGSPAFFNIGASPSTANDIFIAKYDSAGNFTWVTSMGSPTTDEAFVIALDDSNKVYTGGYFTGTADFDPSVNGVQTITSSSVNDAFIARHSPCSYPLAPASITGLDTACLSITGAVYTAAPVAGATSYTWTLPSGWTGTSTTNTIAVTSNTTSGTISVKANTNCGISIAATKLVTLTPGPSAAPTSITGGIATPCASTNYTFTASGGTGGSYFVWNIPAGVTIVGPSNGASIVLQMPATPGAITIGVARANICDTTTFVTRALTVTAAINGSVAPATPSICAGASVSLTASGGNVYAWSNGLGAGATKSVSPTTTTEYTVTISPTTGCPDIDTVVVTVNPAVVPAISPATVTICNGQSATITASGGTIYTWSNSGGSNAAATFSPTTSTTYTVTVSDGTCSATASRLVTVNPLPNAGINPANTPCSGSPITLTGTGGVSYAWSNGGGNNASATFSPTVATTYTVTVTSFNTCTAIATRLVNVNPLPTAAIQPATVTICVGQSTILTASGGGSYAWSNSGGNSAAVTFSPAATTTYTVTVTGANTCSATATATVTVNQLPTAAIAPAIVSICNGDQATLTASGGTAYSWSNSGGSNAAATFSPTTTTTYTVTVTDNNCSATASRLVTVNSIPSASISPVTATICNGASATLTASGGTTYAWSNSGGSNAAATFSPTNTTTYTVTVSNGTCSATATRVVTVNALPATAIAPASVAVCEGSSATLTASGGTTYAWSNSGGSNAAATFSPTTTTTYTVTVTDGNNCSTTATRQVTVNQLPLAGISPSSVTICSGASQNLIASGGASYNWSNQLGTGASKLVIPVATTTYTVTVTDANSCSATAASVVTVNPITNITTEPVSQTACTGSAVTFNVAANGAGLTYQWRKDGNNINLATASTYSIPSLTINDAEDYSVVVTGTCGADTSAVAVLSVVTSASISQQPLAQAVCVGAPLTLSVVGSGGNNTTYVWRRGSTVLGSQTSTVNIPSATANDAGPYSVVISGSCGTVSSDTVLVTVNNNPTAAISGNGTICTGASTTLTASGGSSYAWSNALGSNAAVTVSLATATTYTVTVTQNNCSATASQLVTVNQLPVAAISPASVTLCAGASTTLTASGGTSYLWNTNNTTAAITVSPGTTNAYAVTVTDGNNCSATAQRTVTVNPLPVAAISPSSVAICLGSSQTLTASGGASYVWSGSLTANAIQNLSPATTTTYTTTVTDANNCSATASATITVNSTTAAINGPTTICSGLSATLTASGGGTYSWSNSETTAAITVTPVSATTYTVTVTANNCTATASQAVSVQNTPTASITGSTSVCAGGSVSLTANGGNTYTWGNGLGTSSTITVSPATTTTYTVTASLGVNCSASATHTIAILQPSASAFSQTICAGNSYSFNGESLTQSGAYNDTLVNAVGCDSVITLNLTVSPALTGDFSETICNGSSYTFFAQTLTQSGNYTETVQTQDGCDSIITLHLTVLAPITTTLAESICQGGSYDFNGDILTIAGVYADTLASAQNCDSIVTLTLSIADATAITTQPASTLTVCSGEAIDLNVVATGGNLNYQWWKNDTLVSGAEAASFNIASSAVSDAGAYKVEVTGTCGADTSDAAVVAVNATPAPVVQQNNAVLASSVTGSSYQWYLDGGPVSLATAQTYTATQTGDYKVEVTSADGCTGTSAEVNVIISGIANVAAASIAVYPNPATNLLIIKSDVAIQAVEVHNVIGEKVWAETGNITRLDINMLAQGSYVLTIQTLSGQVKKSFIKE